MPDLMRFLMLRLRERKQNEMLKRLFAVLTALMLLISLAGNVCAEGGTVAGKETSEAGGGTNSPGALEEGEPQSSSTLSLSDYNGKRIGIPSGASFDLIVSKALPDAELSYYNNLSDLLAALSAGKIDAFPSDEPVIRYIMGENSSVSYLPEFLDSFEFAYGFANTEHGRALCSELNEFIDKLSADGVPTTTSLSSF